MNIKRLFITSILLLIFIPMTSFASDVIDDKRDWVTAQMVGNDICSVCHVTPTIANTSPPGALQARKSFAKHAVMIITRTVDKPIKIPI